jgi:hypothetical protein
VSESIWKCSKCGREYVATDPLPPYPGKCPSADTGPTTKSEKASKSVVVDTPEEHRRCLGTLTKVV